MRLIKFTLSAPLQSWGEDSRWDYRGTAAMPTKSAIIGLLGCCLGYPRGDKRLNHLNQSLSIAIRADRPGTVMTDYHTVQGTNGVFFNAEGKPRTGGDTIITPKQYLQDARFTVFLWGDQDALNTCYYGMRHPKWAVYLGRKSCVPAVPILPKWMEANSPEDAIACFDSDERAHSVPNPQVEIDSHPNAQLTDAQRMLARRDQLIRADKNEYAIRWVKAYSIHSGGESSCI